MTAETTAWIVLAVALLGAAVTALVIAGRWIESRAHAEQVAADTFPTAGDVAASEADIKWAETEAVIEEMVVRLTDARAHVERLRRAAS